MFPSSVHSQRLSKESKGKNEQGLLRARPCTNGRD